MASEINRVQKLQLELIKRASFNLFDGESVVKDLLKHKELWQGVVMTSDYYTTSKEKGVVVGGANLICLRDIVDDDWNVDTIFITVGIKAKGKQEELRQLVKKGWKADEVVWLGKEEACEKLGSWPADSRVLRVWWD